MSGTGGRPAYVPTPKDRDQVSTMSGMGIPDYDIAKVMGLSNPTLRKYFAAELDIGHVKANAAVARSLYRQATDPAKTSVVAAIFWLKCRAGWKEESDDGMGKKDHVARAAKAAAGGKFAPAAPPKLVADHGKAVNS